MSEQAMTDSAPDWPPQTSAIGVPNGTFMRGSTGQLFVANDGQWVRVRKPTRVEKAIGGQS
jgi:hypothetical protein